MVESIQTRTKSVCIVSLRCAAGLQKEIDCLAAGFGRLGWQSSQILAAGYRGYRDEAPTVRFVPTSTGYGGMVRDLWHEANGQKLRSHLRALKPNLVLFYNQSPLNLQLLQMRRDFPGCTFGVCLHDPWKTEKIKYGPRYALTYKLVEWLQQLTLNRVQWVITLSDFGTELLRTYYPSYRGRHTQARILLPARATRAGAPRQVFSIIGRINASTGHTRFLTIAAQVRRLRPGMLFEVVTSSSAANAPAFRAAAETAGVRILCQPVLSEVEIEQAIERSWAVFRLDDELTQSGVVPVCYRAGTPVVVTDIPGLTQHVADGVTGRILRAETSAETMVAWLEELQDRSGDYEAGCRAAFAREWAEENFERHYGHTLAQW